MERLENVLARQRQNLILDILLVVVLVIALGTVALSLSPRGSASTDAEDAAGNLPRIVHAGSPADTGSIL